MNPSGHLLLEEAVAFARADGSMPPAERLAISDHAAECGACRALLAEARATAGNLAPVFAGLVEAGKQEEAPATEPWTGAEEFSVGLPGFTPTEQAELRTFQARLDEFGGERFVPGGTLGPAKEANRQEAPATREAGADASGWWQRLFSWPGLPVAGAMAVVVLSLTIVLPKALTMLRDRHPPATAVQTPRADIVDGPLQVSAGGALEGLAAIPEDLREAVAETIRRGAAPGALLGKLTRGGGENAPAPAAVPNDPSLPTPVFPVKTSVDTDRPTFRWQAPAAATNVLVVLRPSAGGEEVRSLPLPAGTLQWTPPTSLNRGALYRWQVVAVTPEGQETTPAAAAKPGAVFKVLSADTHARLEALRAGPGGQSHLTLGVAYAREGLREEAAREFQALKEGNAQSTLAQRLVDSLEGKGG